MKAAQIIAPKEPLQLKDLEIPKPNESQVLVKVKAVGVCHSDLHLWDGGYDTGSGSFMKATDRGVKFPVTPGHEVVGTITQVGNSVKEFKIGDEVLVYPWIGCGVCPACVAENENLCDAPRSLGVFQNGGYAEYVLIPHFKYLIKITGIDLEGAASLACSGLTAFSAVKKANVKAGEFLVIIGAGGLGLMGIQIAKAITKGIIICADLDDNKLEAAKKLGAEHTINSKDPEAVQKIISLCNNKGAECIIDFVNAPPTVKMGLALLRKRGNLILVGLFGGSAEIVLPTIPLKAITIQGAYTGNYASLVELVELAKKGVINPIISKRYSLGDVNTALGDLKQGKIIGRAVINP